MFFELILFIYVIAPEQRISMENWFRRYSVASDSGHSYYNPDSNYNKIIDLLISREDQFINDYNSSLINFFVLFIVILYLIVAYIIVTKYNPLMPVHIIYSIFTVIFVAFFQYNMYLFAYKFEYPGQDEIIYKLLYS
jgi:hypothetical protein